MGPLHTYSVDLAWTGAGASGTASYTSYSRDHEVRIGSKPPLLGSSDPAFRGDPDRFNPEELLVSSLAQCHMLWFLHLASAASIVVVGYEDRAVGTMRIEAAGAGQFREVVLRPRVVVGHAGVRPDGSTITDALLADVHRQAHEHCFISRSVNFPVRIEPIPLRAAEVASA